MTTIAAYIDKANGTTYIGSDSLMTNDVYQEESIYPKIIGLRNSSGGDIRMYIGTAGDSRIRLPFIGDNRMIPPKDFYRETMFQWAQQLSEYVERYKIEKKWSLLIITPNMQIFKVYMNYVVDELACDYDAIGSGAQIAKGSLYTSQDMPWTGQQKVEKAIEAATKHSHYTGGKIHIERL
jgi:ATP-dependent protease HslVU (ClpYQ) peptidase subunit